MRTFFRCFSAFAVVSCFLGMTAMPLLCWADQGPLPSGQPVLRRLPTVESAPVVESPKSDAAKDSPMVTTPEEVTEPSTLQSLCDYWHIGSLKQWSGSFELGLNGTEGNTETFNIRFGGKLKRSTEHSKQTLKLRFVDKTNQGKSTARNGVVGLRTEWPLKKSPWAGFLHGTGEYDEFKPFDARVTMDGGLSYSFIKRDTTELVGRFGGAVSHEIGGPDDAYVPEMHWGLKLRHNLSKRQKLAFDVACYPSVDHMEDYRLNSQASWTIVVDPELGLSLKFSAADRYDSTPHGANPNDIDYAILMLWEF